MPWGQIAAGSTQASGFLLIDKNPQVTSHDCVCALRRLLGTRKIGHAGTLDPMATGLLVIGVGRATKLMQYALGQAKRYTATVCLGARSTTDDADGVLEPLGIDSEAVGEDCSQALTTQIDAWISARSGCDILQHPSAVSAIKRDGVRAYERVRAGEDVRLDARPVHIYSMKRTSPVRFMTANALRGAWEPSSNPEQRSYALFDVDVTVSAGTYIRALARDLGEDLACGGHLQALRRESIGSWQVGMTIRELNDHLLSGGELPLIGINEVCENLFAPLELNERQCRDISYGKFLEMSVLAGSEDTQAHHVNAEQRNTTHVGQELGPWAAYYHGHVVALLQVHRIAGGSTQVLKPAQFFTAPELLRELTVGENQCCPMCLSEERVWHVRENSSTRAQKNNNNV